MCRLSGGIYIRKEKKKITTLICWLLKIADDTLFCFQSVKFSKNLAYGPCRLSNDCHYLEGDLHLSGSIIRFGPPEGYVSLYASASACVRASKSWRDCLPAFLSPAGGGGGGTLFLFINLSESPIPWGRSVFLSVYVKDFERESLQSRELLIEIHYLTERLIGCGTSGIPRKFKAERKSIVSLRPQNAKRNA